MLIGMVFLALLLPPLGFLLPPPLGFFHHLPLRLLLYVRLMLLGLHRISKLATHTRHHLEHFYFMANSWMSLLPMNIGMLHSSLTNILLGVVNETYSFGLSIQLATNYPMELVSSYSQNPSQTSILWWHTLCIPTCYFSMPNVSL